MDVRQLQWGKKTPEVGKEGLLVSCLGFYLWERAHREVQNSVSFSASASVFVYLAFITTVSEVVPTLLL